jgi:hypothetical protein
MPRRALWRWPLVLTAGLAAVHLFGAGTVPEYEVKAAFLYKFATYVHWPALSEVEVRTPFVIGVIGVDPFGPALSGVVRGQRVQGRSIQIRNVTRADETLRCDLLFVSSSERENLQEIFAVLRRAPVLTVGEMDQFAEQGGMIALITEDNRIRFKINPAAVERAGLKVPSQLLKLARIVEETRADRGRR